jgi:hypothetical protein
VSVVDGYTACENKLRYSGIVIPPIGNLGLEALVVSTGRSLRTVFTNRDGAIVGAIAGRGDNLKTTKRLVELTDFELWRPLVHFESKKDRTSLGRVWFRLRNQVALSGIHPTDEKYSVGFRIVSSSGLFRDLLGSASPKKRMLLLAAATLFLIFVGTVVLMLRKQLAGNPGGWA